MLVEERFVVTSLQLSEFCKKFNEGGYPGKRFGQAFASTFLNHLIDNDEEGALKLFNEMDTLTAAKMAQTYVM